MLAELKDELLQAAADKSLSTERRELAIDLLDFLDTAPASYDFDESDYAPEVIAVMREARTVVDIQARWYVPKTFAPVPAPSPRPVAAVEIENLF